MRALVVGAGVVGGSIAYELRRRGVDVELIDAGRGPSPTTRASLGILTHFNGGDNPYSRLYQDGHAGYKELAAQLREETGIDIGWRPLGGIDLIFNDADEGKAEELLRFNQARGCAAEWLDPARLRRLEPRLSPRARGGVYFPDDHRVDPVQLSQALLQAAGQRGTRIFWDEPLESFEEMGQEGVVVRTRSGRRSADFVVLAAGSWTGELGRLLNVHIPVRPVRGQHCRYAGGEELRHILRYDGHYLVRSQAEIIVGATVEEVEFELDTTPEAAAHFEGIFRQVLALEPQVVEHRAGLRPKPKGGRPLIGPLRDFPRIFAVTGHYKNGVLLGPVTGKVVSEWIVEGEPDRDMAYFAPER